MDELEYMGSQESQALNRHLYSIMFADACASVLIGCVDPFTYMHT